MRIVRNSVVVGLLSTAVVMVGGTAASQPASTGVASSAVASATGRTVYVAPDGDDGNAGTIDAPWRSIQHAVDQLQPGDELRLRGGTYHQRDISVDAAGTASEPITIRNEPGEQVTIDGSFPEFLDSPATAWEPYDTSDPQGVIYRSTRTYDVDDQVYGYLGPDDGSWRLIPYERWAPFATDREAYDDSGDYFVASGLFANRDGDGRLYVRLKHNRYQIQRGFQVPASLDPRQTPLMVFGDQRGVEFGPDAAYIRFEGIDVRYAGTPIYLREGSHHITISDTQVQGGRYDIQLRDGVHDVLLDRITVHGGIPPWVPRNDAKRPSSDRRPAHQLQGAAVTLVGGPSNVEIRNSVFDTMFDAIDATKAPHHVRVHHNTFRHIIDDVMEIGSAGWQVEVDHNAMIGVNAGPSWNGSGEPPSDQVGTKYIHHNIIDASTPFLYGRWDPEGQLGGRYDGPGGDGMATGRAFGMHSSSSIDGPDPWKVYNNTIVNNVDIDHEGMGLDYPVKDEVPSRDDRHEVYNNIFVQVDDGYLLRGVDVASGAEVYDGNLYYHAVTSPSKSILAYWTNGGDDESFDSLAQFRASSYFAASKEHYSPGFESHGVEVFSSPIDADYLPVLAAATSGGVDVSGRDWPGLPDARYRGAVEPGTSGTVGAPHGIGGGSQGGDGSDGGGSDGGGSDGGGSDGGGSDGGGGGTGDEVCPSP